MSIKKLVGAIAALTIASSALACFTTVANADGTNEENGQEIAFVTDMKNKKVTYFSEAEDLYGATLVENSSCSKNKGAYFSEDTKIIELTLYPGIYQIEAGVIGNGNKDITIKVESIYDLETEDFRYEMKCSTADGYKSYTKDEIILRYVSKVTISASDAENLLDYILITEPEVTISSEGIFDGFRETPVRAYTAEFEMDAEHAPVTGIEFTVGKCDEDDAKLRILEGTEKKVLHNFDTTLSGEGEYIMGIVVYNENPYEIATPSAVLVTATED